MTGREVFGQLKGFKNEWGKPPRKWNHRGKGAANTHLKKRKRHEKQKRVELEQRWKKRSIFFKLPYWKVSVNEKVFYFLLLIFILNIRF